MPRNSAVHLDLTLTTTRIVEAFSCGGNMVRLDVYVRDNTYRPFRRQWVLLTEAEWRALRRLRPRSEP